MTFELRPNEYLRAFVREPEHDTDRVVVAQGARDATVDVTLKESARTKSEWTIELCRSGDDNGHQVAVLGRWSSQEGTFPPYRRNETTII